MIIQKTYVSRYPKFSLDVDVDGKIQEVRFRVRHVDTGGVKLVTTDQALQQALEDLPDFNIHFKLESTEELPEPEKPAKKTAKKAKEQSSEDSQNTGADPGQDPGENTKPGEGDEDPQGEGESTETGADEDETPAEPEVKEFKTGQEARDWLVKEKGVPVSRLSNNTKIVEEAKKINVELSIG